jgi:hypothetical protein
MLIGFWTGVLIAIALVFVLIYAFAKIAKMMKKAPGGGGVIGFFVGFALLVVLLIVPSRAYVVTGETDCDEYIVFGSPEYEMTGGEKVTIAIPSGQCMVINNTTDRVMVEEVVYGGYGFSPSPWQVSGMKYGFFETGTIDYFFENSPPDEISVSDGADEVSKWWLRRARE